MSEPSRFYQGSIAGTADGKPWEFLAKFVPISSYNALVGTRRLASHAPHSFPEDAEVARVGSRYRRKLQEGIPNVAVNIIPSFTGLLKDRFIGIAYKEVHITTSTYLEARRRMTLASLKPQTPYCRSRFSKWACPD
jgi:hypothetical protein